MRQLIALVVAGMLTLTACGQPEPVATGYKKQLGSGATGADDANGAGTGTGTGTGTPPPAGGQGNLTAGKAIWDSRCANCHAIKPVNDLAQLALSKPKSYHNGVQWPSDAEAPDLVAYLKPK